MATPDESHLTEAEDEDPNAEDEPAPVATNAPAQPATPILERGSSNNC